MAIEIREFTPADASAVARLFKASDSAWPGGFQYNVEVPPEAMLEELRSERTRNVYLAWDGDRAVGFASFADWLEEKTGYLWLLTADPEYHGRGVGRDLILRVLDRCVELGYRKLTLHTWPGNTRAVPLYKKTGFQWGPEAHELQNYVPMLLTHPLTRSYFERTDWYRCQKRDLRLGLDSERRNGALVFDYEWEGPSGALRAVFDQKAKRLVELDTPSLRIGLEADSAECLGGDELEVRLFVENSGTDDLALTIRVTGDGPVSCDDLRSLTVLPGAREQIGLRATASKGEAGDGTIKADLRVNGEPLELGLTVEVKRPVELSLVPTPRVLGPGTTFETTLNVRNRLDSPVRATLAASATDGLDTALESGEAEVPEGDTVGVPLRITARRLGEFTLALAASTGADQDPASRPSLTRQVLAVEPGRVLAASGKDSTTLACDRVTVELAGKGTGLTLSDRATGRAIATFESLVGPPYWPTKLEKQEGQLALERGETWVRATSSYDLEDFPGVRLERTVRLEAGGRASIGLRLANTGASPVEVRTMLVGWPLSAEYTAYYPLADGVVRGSGGVPGSKMFGPEASLPFGERWLSCETRDGTLGVLWPEGVEVHSPSGGWGRLQVGNPLSSLDPGQERGWGELVVLPARDWREVREAWNRDRGTHLPEPEIIPSAGVRLVPSPLLIQGDEASAEVQVMNYSPRPMAARVELEAPDGLGVAPRSLELGDVSYRHVPVEPIRVSSTKLRTAYELGARISSANVSGRFRFPAIVLGSRARQVRREQLSDRGEAVWEVDNGWMSFRVRPSKLGVLYSLRCEGREYLHAYYPEPGPMAWGYPVYGGITPVLWEEGANTHSDRVGRLDGPTLGAEPCEVEDGQGVRWSGLRLTARLEHESLRGWTCSLEYLTVPESNVLAVRSRLETSGSAGRANLTLTLYPAFREEVPLLLYPDQAEYGRGGDRGAMGLPGRRWVAVEYGSTGRSLVLVNAAGQEVLAQDIWPDGIWLSQNAEATVTPRCPMRTGAFVVVAEDRDQARLYSSLSRLRDL